jgi:hypothetical protein
MDFTGFAEEMQRGVPLREEWVLMLSRVSRNKANKNFDKKV